MIWKWLGGCLLVCVVLLGIALWQGYRQLASSGAGNGTDTVTIAAPITRVFASIANADSLSGWMGERLGVKVGHHGMLAPGDTLEIETRARFIPQKRKLKWTVTDVRPNQLLAVQLRSDSSGELIATRQLSLAAKGESTFITSAITAPLMDSIRAGHRDTLKASDAYLDAASRLLISGLRLQTHIELEQLKSRIERRSPSSGKR
jgi:uncharacterized protein YndB with AHSA1/START domain